MPIHIFNDAAGGQTFEPISLPREMIQGDFCRLEPGKIPLSDQWLSATFEQNILQVPDSANYNAEKRELGEFLNRRMTGPYFVMEGIVNTRQALSIVIMEHPDIENFKTQYPKWRHNEDNILRNGEILRLWEDEGIQLNDPSLYGYSKPSYL